MELSNDSASSSFGEVSPEATGDTFRESWRFVSAKCPCLKNYKMMKIWFDMQFPEGYANFSGPAGGCSLALAAFLTWCEAL